MVQMYGSPPAGRKGAFDIFSKDLFNNEKLNTFKIIYISVGLESVFCL